MAAQVTLPEESFIFLPCRMQVPLAWGENPSSEQHSSAQAPNAAASCCTQGEQQRAQQGKQQRAQQGKQQRQRRVAAVACSSSSSSSVRQMKGNHKHFGVIFQPELFGIISLLWSLLFREGLRCPSQQVTMDLHTGLWVSGWVGMRGCGCVCRVGGV